MEKKTFQSESENVKKAVAVLKAIETNDNVAVGYINAANYRQHNLIVGDGLEGFGAALAGLVDYPEKASVNTVRAFEDGEFVVCQTDYNFFGRKAGFDIFRFEEGKIVEHWDNLQAKPTQANPSGRTMTDGTTEVKDLDKTEANKALVRNFVEDILVNGKMEKLAGYFNGDNYLQHNPQIPDNLSGLGSALEAMAKQGITMTYSTIHKVLGEGNFVLTVSEGQIGGVHSSFYDLFRVENGKIAEHWDTIEPITSKETWKNQNGKFNF